MAAGYKSRPAPPTVRVSPLGELKVYEISEAELERFAGGPPGQIDLNFALALLPVALTILITLQTATFAGAGPRYVYWIAFWILLVQGIYFGAKWWLNRGKFSRLIEEVRGRMPEPPGLPDDVV